MAATALPNLGTQYAWTLGEDGWKAGMDLNMVLHDWLSQGYISVAAKSVTSQPGAPANGAAYILASTHSGAQWGGWAENDLVIFITGYPLNSGWVKVTPLEGWRVYDRALNRKWVFNGTTWVAAQNEINGVNPQTGTTYTAAASDEDGVITLNNATMTFTFPANATVAFRIGSVLTVVNLNAAAANIADDAAVIWVGTDPTGGTLAQNDKIVARKIATDTWLRLI